MSNKKIHIFDTKAFSEARQKAVKELQDQLQHLNDGALADLEKMSVNPVTENDPRSIPPKAGIMGVAPMKPTTTFEKAGADTVVGPNTNAQIVFGNDRPATRASSTAGNRGAAIDIVVGRMSSVNKGQGPVEGTVIAPSFCNDAARIYLSQQTDADQNFGLAEGRDGQIFGKSAIVAKADAVRVIGRLGVKIVSGRSFAFEAGPHGELDSQGGNILSPAPPIELIAGNYTGPIEFAATRWLPQTTINSLQGVGRGENIRDCLYELSNMLEKVIGVCFNISLIQSIYNGILGINWLNPHYAAGAGLISVQSPVMIQSSLHMLRATKMVWEINYVWPCGFKYVKSRNVSTT